MVETLAPDLDEGLAWLLWRGSGCIPELLGTLMTSALIDAGHAPCTRVMRLVFGSVQRVSCACAVTHTNARMNKGRRNFKFFIIMHRYLIGILVHSNRLA